MPPCIVGENIVSFAAMREKTERLCVVMPVYNEQDVISVVLEKWDGVLSRLGIDYEIRPYNDGSRDASLARMRDVSARHEHIKVKDKPNGGHGHTILIGYREAASDGFDWIFQIDSDDEMGPEKFGELWARRGEYDFLVGKRDGRRQAWSRKIISLVSRICVRIFYGKSIWDVNTPYRLMRVSAFRDFYERLPLTTFAPNVILSGLAARHNLRNFEILVPQYDRITGEVSIKKWKLLKAAVKSFWQTTWFAIATANVKDWARYIGWTVAWGFVLLSLAIGFKNGLDEFDFQWDPAKVLMLGDNPYVYSLEHKPVSYDGFIHQQIGAANQLPSCLLLLAPWTLFPQLLANQIWDFCNLIFTAVFLLFMYKSFSKNRLVCDSFHWIAFILLAGSPLRILIGVGQHLMFSLAFFMPAYYYAEKKKFTVSGILLALSAFKYTTIVPLAFIFISRRWWRPIIIAAAIHIIATIGCGLYLSESPITLILQSFQVSSALTACGNADLASFIASCGSVDVRLWANLGYVICSALLFALAFARCRDDALLLSTFAVVSNVMFYHRVYDFVVLIFPCVYLIENWPRKDFVTQGIKFLVAANIIWSFFLSQFLRFANVLAVDVPVCFVLEHALLAMFLVQFWRSRKLTGNRHVVHGHAESVAVSAQTFLL